MKLRAAVSVLATVAALTACGSSGNKGTPAGSTAAGGGGATSGAPGVVTSGGSGDFCANLIAADDKLSNLKSTTSGGDLGSAKAAIDNAVTVYQQLADSAPAEVKPAIEDLVTVLHDAQDALADPAHPDVTKLQALSTKLPSDLTTLGNYIGTNCHG